MKNLRKILCVLLAFFLFLVVPASAEATDSRASAFFVRHCTYLYEVDGNEFGVWFEVTAKYKMDELGASLIKIQKSSDGSNWTTVKTCYPNSFAQMISTNTAIHANGITYNGTSGYYYRAMVTYYAKSGNNIGEYTTYSDIRRL